MSVPSQQLEIAQDNCDEASMIAWLDQQARLLCLPADMDLDLEHVPRPLGGYSHKRIVVFFEDRADLVVEGGHFTDTEPRKVVFSCPDNDGVVFEWKRTTCDDVNTFIAVGGSGGRIYIRDLDAPTPVSDALRRLVSSLFRWIRRTYPCMIEGRYPVFVGNSLAARVRSGEARLVFPNGKLIGLVANPKYRGE